MHVQARGNLWSIVHAHRQRRMPSAEKREFLKEDTHEEPKAECVLYLSRHAKKSNRQIKWFRRFLRTGRSGCALNEDAVIAKREIYSQIGRFPMEKGKVSSDAGGSATH